MRYTLRQLEVFTAIARVESVSRAAKALGMSQSAVSGALLDLERQFDVRLFERFGKRLTLSELGRGLWPQAEALCEQARELELNLTRQQSGELRVGATLTIGSHVCPPLMASFMRDNAGGRVTLRIANTHEIAQAVKSFTIDVGLVEGELSDPELRVTPWRSDELCVFCSPQHLLAKKRKLSDADLASCGWIVREPGSGTRQAFERALHGLVPSLRIEAELTQTEAILGAVEAGLGLGCVSALALEDAFRLRKLVRCRVPQRDFRRSFFFVLHARKFRTPALDRWLSLCRQTGKPASP
jgi:DNA-binding transcriptional LysR family regulator